MSEVAAMATVCETVEDTMLKDDCTPNCQCKIEVCPPDCCIRPQINRAKHFRLILNAIGILIAVFATYMIISTDSKLYLVFWVCYSVLRRLMVKSKAQYKAKIA